MYNYFVLMTVSCQL